MPSPRKGLVATLFLLGMASVARAEEGGDFCVDRPGLGTPACTIDRGRFALEVGIAEWTLDRPAPVRTDSFVFAESLVRYGLTERLEVQLGWDGIVRQRERAGGRARHEAGGGDLRLALRQRLVATSRLLLSVMPVLTLPVGSDSAGAGDWTVGLVLPAGYELPHGLALALTGELGAAADSDGSGRHFAASGTIGVELPLASTLGATLELQTSRDTDPAGTSKQSLAGLSIAWTPRNSLQLDAGANFGLDASAPDLLYAGVAARF